MADGMSFKSIDKFLNQCECISTCDRYFMSCKVRYYIKFKKEGGDVNKVKEKIKKSVIFFDCSKPLQYDLCFEKLAIDDDNLGYIYSILKKRTDILGILSNQCLKKGFDEIITFTEVIDMIKMHFVNVDESIYKIEVDKTNGKGVIKIVIDKIYEDRINMVYGMLKGILECVRLTNKKYDNKEVKELKIVKKYASMEDKEYILQNLLKKS